MANLVTVLRLLLLFGFLAWVYQSPWQHPLFNVAALGIIFLMDALDGFVARRYGEASVFGAIFDIAADRVVENLLWLVLVELDQVPVWVGMIFLTRSFLVDSLRSGGGQAPFEVMRSPLGRFLVAGAFMRFTYALVKFLAFGWLFMLLPMDAVWPRLWAEQGHWLRGVGMGLVYLATLMCLVRGVPVLVEALAAHYSRETTHGPGAG